MCGIAGVYYRREQIPLNADQHSSIYMPKMLEALSHRGDLQSGWKRTGKAALGMNRLGIVNRHIDQIPYSNETDSVHFVFNGEVYNYPSVRAGLREKHEFRSHTDS